MTETLITGNGITLWTTSRGTGTPIILCNGGPDGFICIAGGRVHNDREWHRVYREKRDQGLEVQPAYEYPFNLDVNKQVTQSYKQYIQRPSLLKDIAQLDRPALFLYGEQDIRPSWPVEQVAQLLTNARLELIHGADHYIWFTHEALMRTLLRKWIDELPRSRYPYPGC